MATQLGSHTLLLTEEILLTVKKRPTGSGETFVVLVSGTFNALLQGVALSESSALDPTGETPAVLASPESELSLQVCQVSLTFDPMAIASFLHELSDRLQAKPTLASAIEASCQLLQLNAPALQAEFTLRLASVLDAYTREAVKNAAHLERLTQLQQQQDSLERQVQLRTQELRDAMLAAQSANRVKGEFLAAVSHELRTPLTAIIGMSATLLRWSLGELSQRQRSFLQTIHNSGQKLLELINGILEFSQIEEGKAVLRLSECSLSVLAQQCLQEMQESANAGAIALDLDLRIAPEYDRFIGDVQRIQQILLNLLSNAIKFTPDRGSVLLRLFADGDSVVFQVKDTGIGIAEEQRSLLFQKFQQLDTSYHRLYTGAGLGLALTKQLVELHGGRITVDSTPGVGSVFTVQLPVRPTDSLKVNAGESDFGTPLGRVVLIEDHEESANILCDLLTAGGYQVIWMVEGSMAMSQIEVLQPVMVILNIQSADSHSDQIVRQLRQNPATKRVKLIALTTDVTSTATQRLLTQVDGYLLKPLQPEQILPVIMALVTEA
jgi:two-component system sensor histidine kinase/response regulator